MAGSPPARGATVKVCGLVPRKVPPDSVQSRNALNVAVPTWLPVTVKLIVIGAEPPADNDTAPVGAVTSTIDSSTSLAPARSVTNTPRATAPTNMARTMRRFRIELLIRTVLLQLLRAPVRHSSHQSLE